MILLSLSSLLLFLNDNNIPNNFHSPIKNIKKPYQSLNSPNSKPLLINQLATTSNSFFPQSLPTNVHFTLVEGWTSKNVTIYYEGISIKKDRVLNGDFSFNADNWTYDSNNPTIFTDSGWKLGVVEFDLNKGNVSKDEYAFYKQNISISQPFNNGTLASFSIDYKYETSPQTVTPENLTLYLAIIVNDVEVNKTLSFLNIINDEWATANLIYDPNIKGQFLPGNVSIKAGVHAIFDLNLTGINDALKIDNVKFEIWTQPNEPNILELLDVDSNLNYTYYNSTYGQGYSFIDTERSKNSTSEIEFTISQNMTNILDFQISNISVNSFLVKTFNSTYNGKEGSLYTTNMQINWETEFLVLNPFLYFNNRIEIKKPIDWDVNGIYDGFGTDQASSCLGTGIGSKTVIIPKEVISQGIWKLEATSVNYITNGNVAVWNGTTYENSSILTYADKFQIQAILNKTLLLDGTIINCTIKYPNGSIFLESSLPASQIVVFGNYTIDHKMVVGEYETLLEWSNNESSIKRDKVGYKRIQFTIWHQTNLKALNSYFETVAGDPLLLKVNFTDSDVGKYIDFATVTYNTSYGSEGSGAYLGSGIYFIDLDTSSLDLGEYYISFNASKDYYQHQAIKNLIKVIIIAEPLALQVPRNIIIAKANNFIEIQINLTGSITGNYFWPANVSSNWRNNYTSIDFSNGTWVFNLSTFNLPTSGIPEFYTITFFANKTGYGSATDFITLRIDPIPTIAYSNQSIFQVYPNYNFYLELNYTIESSGELIQGANISISWSSTYSYTPNSNGYLIFFNTSGLSVDLYTIYIELNHNGYETAFIVVHVMIIPAETQLILLNPEPIEIIKGDKLNISCLYVSNGQNLINSTLYLIGDINGTFQWDGIMYYCSVNTEKLETKSHLIQILATGESIESQIRDLIITIFPLDIEIQISSTTFRLGQEQDNKVDFTIYDKSHNSILTGFNVTYKYNGISNPLIPILNGSYQLDLGNLNLDRSKSSHQIEITVLNPYGEDESITLIVYTSSFDTILTISIIIIISAAALVVSGVIVNKRYLGISKFQREIRSIKKKLKKQKFDKISEPSRYNIIKNILDNQYVHSKISFRDIFSRKFKMNEKM
jgi:hypothetical protein